MYNELSTALRETFRKNKELIKTPDKFIEAVRCSLSGCSASEKDYATLENALRNKLIRESLMLIDNAESYEYKAKMVSQIYLRAFHRILQESVGTQDSIAMFTVIPNLFHILGLCVDPEKENNKIIIEISNCAEKTSSVKVKNQKSDAVKKSLRKERQQQNNYEKLHKMNKPKHVSAIIVNWILVAIFVAFCGVFLFSVLNPPEEPLQMAYSFLSLTLAGMAAFFTKTIKSISEMFGKSVSKEEDVIIQIIGVENKK